MPYSAEISRLNPGCILFLVDQSGSMKDPVGGHGEGGNKANALADALNRLLQNICIKCAKEEGVRDYFHLALIGYGGKTAVPMLSHPKGDGALVPVSEVANNPLRVENRRKKVPDGAGGILEQDVKFPVWVEPIAKGGTPMVSALNLATLTVESWVKAHPDGFPPVVINVTDGESTDGKPDEAANKLKAVGTTDGSTLLFNLHISSLAGAPTAFPASAEGLADEFARQLFDISSLLPPHMVLAAGQDGYKLENGARGFVFNADIVSVVRFLEIGTQPSNLR
jgi:hypothetical protein